MPLRRLGSGTPRLIVVVVLTAAVVAGAGIFYSASSVPHVPVEGARPEYQPRRVIDTAGFTAVVSTIEPWEPDASPGEIGRAWDRAGFRNIAEIDGQLAQVGLSRRERFTLELARAIFSNYEGETTKAYLTLDELRALVEGDKGLARDERYTVAYYQGVTALRIGENDNCIMCRGESSCILPISPAAVHTNPEGSRRAIMHFTEYLERFPDDLEVRWLLNLAHMTLGEHPQKVNPRYLISLDRFRNSEFDIGRFRDVGHLVGVNRFNQAGGAIMEDFDHDGLLDIVTTTWAAAGTMAFYRNNGEGSFDDETREAGLSAQMGGLYCVQTDFNNDGFRDVLIVRGAWLQRPVRPSLLVNNGDGTFSDVTLEADLLHPVNSISASWADYDNDGCLDLFICCERQPSRLYRNLGDGAFEEIAGHSGVLGKSRLDCKGSAWIDFDNDGWQDLFLTFLTPEGSQLFHNNRDGTFTDVTRAQSIDGPSQGFSCWAWDYDNDGWLDLFATSYDRSLADVVKGLLGEPHSRNSNRLYHNLSGRGFEDKTRDAGLDLVLATMGSNYGDFDNDGFLDMYLGTGDPDLAFLDPCRMFKNVSGRRFAEITGSSGTGNLQKGHAVACGDWDRDGDTDIFIEMGGALPGDRYHNILYQNPGQKNHSLTVNLVGRETNRAAIGAVIKVVTGGAEPLTVYRHVSSGSSFGANSLQQTIGVAGAEHIERLEIHWPTSRTTQVFHNVAADQTLEITEFAEQLRRLKWSPIPLPE